MCGIVAYLNNQGVTGQLDLLPALDLINHRGPDSRGSLFLNNAGLGHCRLSIMDPENGIIDLIKVISQCRISRFIVLLMASYTITKILNLLY